MNLTCCEVHTPSSPLVVATKIAKYVRGTTVDDERYRQLRYHENVSGGHCRLLVEPPSHRPG